MSGPATGLLEDTAPRKRFWRRVFDNKWVLRFLGLAVILGAWQYYFSGGRVAPVMAAPPSKIVTSIISVMTNGDYYSALLNTVQLFAYGFAIAAVLGVVLGFLLGRVKVLDRALTPYMNALYASPLPAVVPILTAVLGYAIKCKLVIVVILGVFPVLINAEQGAKGVDTTVLEVAKSLRVSRMRLWVDVIYPSSVPYLAVGLRLGAARALIGTAVAELYTAPNGLGYQILRFGMKFDMDSMFVIVLTYTALGVSISTLFRMLERRTARWIVQE